MTPAPSRSYKEGGLWIKNGHIPGANSLPWRTLMTKDNARLMKSDEELQATGGQIQYHS